MQMMHQPGCRVSERFPSTGGFPLALLAVQSYCTMPCQFAFPRLTPDDRAQWPRPVTSRQPVMTPLFPLKQACVLAQLMSAQETRQKEVSKSVCSALSTFVASNRLLIPTLANSLIFLFTSGGGSSFIIYVKVAITQFKILIQSGSM